MRKSVVAAPVAGLGAAALSYWLVVTGRATLDLGWGRRERALGPFAIEVAAPAETVFDVVAEPYLGRSTRALAEKLKVLERTPEMILAEHYTPAGAGMRAVTVETVVFERPHRVSFRLLRGPVPHVVEHFDLSEGDGVTTLTYSGELGTDFGAAGAWWGRVVAVRWERAVRETFASVKDEAERRERTGRAREA
ncbi:MAG TPA: SRPBCC family protein [Acidimicrobiales bacterium]|nr:SRPBCC family protein [Acidimicrobiales bacterium]